MGVKLISQVNGDGDIIEAWLNHYLRLGVDRFHLVLHGSVDENEKLLSIKNSYPITIESTYSGPFDSDQKKDHLDAVLARCPNEWVVIADSDEFVEFPYGTIPETIEALSGAGANLMAAPMLQRIAADGSFTSASVIDDPFQSFPLCSSDLYWKVGIKAEIFKFPLFFCGSETRLLEEGNHNPPLGNEPREARVLGVTHHFKFRRTLSQRLDRRINSTHQFRQESLELREYLDAHGDRLPIDDAFLYSRSELFRRGLLRKLSAPYGEQSREGEISTNISLPRTPNSAVEGVPRVPHGRAAAEKATVFVVHRSTDGAEFHSYIVEVLRRLCAIGERVALISLGEAAGDTADDGESEAERGIRYRHGPGSFLDWVRFIRKERPQRIVFCYDWLEAFPWHVGLAARMAGVRKRFAIQQMMPVGAPALAKTTFPISVARRLFGARTRRMVRIRIAARSVVRTISTSQAVMDALVRDYRFPPKRTVRIASGVSTSRFRPCEATSAEVRTRLGINPDDFVLICTAELTEQKGIDLLIHALSRVLRKGIQCKCILTGDGPLREQHVKKANSLGLFNFVFFERCKDDVERYMQSASAFILSSFWEGFPVSVLRAMACGLPCIATDVGGVTEAVRDQATGIVIPSPASVDAIEAAIEYLVSHPCERMKMGARAREIACRDFELADKVAELKVAIAD